MSFAPLRLGRCWFFDGVTDAESIAKMLEEGKPCPLDDWAVVRADNSENIYVVGDGLFHLCLENMRQLRFDLRGKSMLLEQTAFHKNIVELGEGNPSTTYFTFGNFFGEQAILIESGELPEDFCTNCVAKKMANVQLEFSASGGIKLVDWKERA